MGLSYDRRVPEESLKALEPGGFAHSLVEFGGSGMWALDLQLRGLGEAKKQHRATLYVGTTKVVDLHLKGQSFALSAHPTLACGANGWVAAWTQWHHDRWFDGGPRSITIFKWSSSRSCGREPTSRKAWSKPPSAAFRRPTSPSSTARQSFPSVRSRRRMPARASWPPSG